MFEMLARVAKGEKVAVSTLDREMFKWRFKEATGYKIELESLEVGDLYNIKIIDIV